MLSLLLISCHMLLPPVTLSLPWYEDSVLLTLEWFANSLRTKKIHGYIHSWHYRFNSHQVVSTALVQQLHTANDVDSSS